MVKLFENMADSFEKKYLEESVENTFEVDYAKLEKLATSLNEGPENPDSALLRSAYKKIDGKQTNIKKLSAEELDALERNGIDAWAWAGETKMVSPNSNDIIKGRREDRYYVGRNGHPTSYQDVDKMDLADRAIKMDARDKDQDIKAGPRDNYQTMNRRYDANKMSEPVDKMKSALRRRNDAQRELNDAEFEFKDRERNNAAKHSKDVHDSEIMYAKTDKELNRRLDDNSARIQAILDRHKRESLELIECYLSELNEAEMSDADRIDTELIRSAQTKLSRRSNAKLSDDELKAIERHHLVPYRNGLVMDDGNSRYLPNDEKANLARMADKRPERLKHGTELYNADFSDSADRNEKNYSTKYSWERTQQDKERALDAARMGKDYDEMDRLVRDKHYIKNKISDNDAERINNLKTANSRRDAETERNKSRLARIQKENPEVIKQAQAEIDSLLRKNESINEAITDSEARRIRTGLENNKVNQDILEGVLGQMSDGIWENSPGMEKYWYPVNIDGVDIVIDSGRSTGWSGNQANPYYEMSDEEVKRFFANKIKRVAQEYLNDNNMNPYNGFNEDNEEVCRYFHGEPTIGDAYKAYKVMK